MVVYNDGLRKINTIFLLCISILIFSDKVFADDHGDTWQTSTAIDVDVTGESNLAETYTLKANSEESSVYLEPFENPTQELFFRDFNGDGKADMAVRTVTAGTNGDVDVYFAKYVDEAFQGEELVSNGDFETGDFSGWTKTGTAFDSSPTQNSQGGTFSGWNNDWYVNTWFAGETVTGTIRSNPFALAGTNIEFGIAGWSAWGGGASNWNYVTLNLADGTEIDRVYTPNQNAMIAAILDGSGYQNQQVYIEVVDNGTTNGFAWLAVDNFRMTSATIPLNGNFSDGNLTGWTKTGTSFDSCPTTNTGGGVFSDEENGWYANTLFAGESLTGTLVSNPFVLTSSSIEFLIGGWSAVNAVGRDWNYVTLHLASDDSELDRVYTPSRNKLKANYLSSPANIGQQVYIKVTDDADGSGFAWISVDEFHLTPENANRYTFNVQPDISSSGMTVNNREGWGLFFADINGDGLADLINHYKSTGDIFVHTNLGTDFSPGPVHYAGLAQIGDEYRIFFADINGDSFDDYCVLNEQTGYFEAYRNISGTFESSAYVAQTIGTPSYPFSGSEALLSDIDGDGSVDFVDFNQNTMIFTCHKNTGTSFSVTGESFKGLHEKYEYQYFLEDFDGDGAADLTQVALRRGDILAHRIYQTHTNELTVSSGAFLRFGGAPSFTFMSESRNIIANPNRSVNVMLFYEIDRDPEFGLESDDDAYYGNGGWRHDSGWQKFNPNHTLAAPETTAPLEAWRTTTPLLGLYAMKDPEVIKQHAYWMKAMGVDTVLLDWTNLPVPLWEYTLKILEVYDGITEFVPPKLTVGYRMQETESPFTTTQEIADTVWRLCQRFPDLWFTTCDGTAQSNKPVLILWPNFSSDSAWKDSGPVWTDSRFNMRYMNGYLKAPSNGVTVYEDADWDRMKNDYPYWGFVENDPKPGHPGYYRNLYRRLPGTDISEFAITWIAIYTATPTEYDWDGQFDLVDGKYCLQRYSEPLYAKPPRITFLNRWCYPAAWYLEPQEGMSLNDSTIIEPSTDVGFDNFDLAADIMFDLRKLEKHAPGKPVINSIEDGMYVGFDSSNFPTHYKVSADIAGDTEQWQFININEDVIQLPYNLQGQIFYLRTKNTFGESAPTKFGYDLNSLSLLASNWLQSCAAPSWCQESDYDQSFNVDLDDYAIMFTQQLSSSSCMESLAGYWQLDEASGSVASDLSGNNNHGSVIGYGRWVAGKFGGCMSFDIDEEYISSDGVCADVAGGDLSFSAWIKCKQTKRSNVQQVIASFNTSTGGNRLSLGHEEGSTTLGINDDVWRDTGVAILDSNWHHVAYTLDNSSNILKVYIDGEIARTVYSAVSIASDDKFSIAQKFEPGSVEGSFYEGLIDDVRIYTKVLTVEEIEMLSK